MQLIDEQITLDELKKMSDKMFGGLVKAVVDIDKEVMVVDAELHADQEEMLLNLGSEQHNLWGINIYPSKSYPEMIEFDSMINVRPSDGNRSRSIENQKIQEKIITIIKRLIKS